VKHPISGINCWCLSRQLFAVHSEHVRAYHARITHAHTHAHAHMHIHTQGGWVSWWQADSLLSNVPCICCEPTCMLSQSSPAGPVCNLIHSHSGDPGQCSYLIGQQSRDKTAMHPCEYWHGGWGEKVVLAVNESWGHWHPLCPCLTVSPSRAHTHTLLACCLCVGYREGVVLPLTVTCTCLGDWFNNLTHTFSPPLNILILTASTNYRPVKVAR
jgi:hypothetical protein